MSYVLLERRYPIVLGRIVYSHQGLDLQDTQIIRMIMLKLIDLTSFLTYVGFPKYISKISFRKKVYSRCELL